MLSRDESTTSYNPTTDILRTVIRFLLLGFFAAAICVAVVFIINYAIPSSPLLLPLGILVSGLLGCLVFLFGSYLNLK